MSVAILCNRIIAVSIPEFLMLISIEFPESKQSTYLEIGLSIWLYCSPDQQSTSDKNERIDNHLILGRVSLEASSEDIGILCIFAYREIIRQTELSITVIASCFLGSRFSRKFCQGNDCAVAEACAFAERCCRCERPELAFVGR